MGAWEKKLFVINRRGEKKTPNLNACTMSNNLDMLEFIENKIDGGVEVGSLKPKMPYNKFIIYFW